MSTPAKKSDLLLDNEWGTGEAERFRRLALRYQEIGALYGIKLNPFRAPHMPFFQKATPEQRKAACDHLDIIVSIHEETMAASESAINTKQLLWRALRRLSLVPRPEALDLFGDEDVVLIYNEEQLVMFWNLQFFKHSSITVEELFFAPWYNFTKREPAMQQKLMQMAQDLLSGRITGTFTPDVPEHLVEEVDTLECLKVMMAIPCGSILTKNGNWGGVLIVQKMRVIS